MFGLVWVLNFQGIAQPVDLLFSTEQTTEIILGIINDLRSGFDLAQLSDKPTTMKVELTETHQQNEADEYTVWHRK